MPAGLWFITCGNDLGLEAHEDALNAWQVYLVKVINEEVIVRHIDNGWQDEHAFKVDLFNLLLDIFKVQNSGHIDQVRGDYVDIDGNTPLSDEERSHGFSSIWKHTALISHGLHNILVSSWARSNLLLDLTQLLLFVYEVCRWHDRAPHAHGRQRILSVRR